MDSPTLWLLLLVKPDSSLVVLALHQLAWCDLASFPAILCTVISRESTEACILPLPCTQAVVRFALAV